MHTRTPLLLLILVLLPWMPGCGVPAQAQDDTDSASEATPAATLVISGDVRGYLEPCECVEGMLGGWPRRGSLIRYFRNRGRRVLPLDAGNLTAGFGRQEELKQDVTFETLKLLEYAAINVGPEDLRLGLKRYRRGVRSHDLPAVSANLVETKGGERVFDSHRVLTVTDGLRIGVVGLVTRDAGPEIENVTRGRVTVADPKKAFDATRKALAAEGVDAIVLLWAGPIADARKVAGNGTPPLLLAATDRRNRAAVGTKVEDLGRGPISKPKTGPLLAGLGEKGKEVVQIDIHRDPLTLKGRVRPIESTIPDLPALAEKILAYRRRLIQEGLVAALERKPIPSGGTYVGSRTCQSCHPGAWEAFARSKHQEAFAPLEAKEATGDPECLVCHVVGLHYEGGYESREKTPALAEVGCESCHGPGSNHVRSPGPDYGGTGGKAGCIECHDPQNSPTFDFARYWKKIAH